MSPDTDLTNHFLIAMPQLEDPNFFHTVTYICEHSSDGAMGIVINRPMELNLADIFEQLKIPIASEKVSEQPVYIGGPVQSDRGFVLHDSNSEGLHPESHPTDQCHHILGYPGGHRRRQGSGTESGGTRICQLGSRPIGE